MSAADGAAHARPCRDAARIAHEAQAGFTLVEVMVSLLIFGMLAAAGVAMLSFSVRAQAATGAKLDDLAALNRTSRCCPPISPRRRPRATRDEAGTVLPAFVGERGSGVPMLRFVRGGWTNLDARRAPSAQKVAYRLADGDAGAASPIRCSTAPRRCRRRRC